MERGKIPKCNEKMCKLLEEQTIGKCDSFWMILAITMTTQHQLKLQNWNFQENDRLEGDLCDQ